MKQAILVIDTGSSSMRGVLYGDSGQIIDAHQVAYRMLVVEEQATQSPDDFTGALLDICTTITTRCKEYLVVAIALTSQRSSVVPVSKLGKPIDNVMMWYDRRSNGICDQINEKCATSLKTICGMQATPVLSAPKICWYKQARPDIYAQAHKFMGIHDYLLHHLTGRFVTDTTLASRTNLFDIAQHRWSEDALSYYGIAQDKLCDVVPVGSVVGAVTAQFAARAHLPAQVQVITCGGDQQSSAVGAGLRSSGQVAVTAGSGGYAVRLIDSLSGIERCPANISVAVQSGRWLAEASCMATGTAYDWIRRTFMGELAGVGELDQLLLQTVAGAHGVVMSAALDGQNIASTSLQEQCDAVGLRLDINRADIVRAAFEAVVAGVADCCALLQGIGEPVQSMFVTGGLSNFQLFNQTLADMTNTTVCSLSLSETTCLGAWAQATVSLAVYPSIEQAIEPLIRPNQIFTPNALHHAIYARQSHLRQKMCQQVHKGEVSIMLEKEDRIT